VGTQYGYSASQIGREEERTCDREYPTSVSETTSFLWRDVVRSFDDLDDSFEQFNACVGQLPVTEFECVGNITDFGDNCSKEVAAYTSRAILANHPLLC
jgi:hypothetical protein